MRRESIPRRLRTPPGGAPAPSRGGARLARAGEHAYYLQYKNVRPEYLKQIWSIVNWKDVESRYLAAK